MSGILDNQTITVQIMIWFNKTSISDTKTIPTEAHQNGPTDANIQGQTERATRKVAIWRSYLPRFFKKKVARGDEPPPLGATWRDRGVSAGKGMVGLVPYGGSILAEIVGNLIPDQREQRIEKYLSYLNDRIGNVDNHEIRAKLKTPESIELFEEGAIQSARALSDERRERIARLVASGMTGDEKDKIEAKRLLTLLGELDDDQIIILTAHHDKFGRDPEFRKKHENVIKPTLPHMNSSRDEREKYTVSKIAKDHLIRLDLLSPQFDTPKDGQVPEFDNDTGMLKARYISLSPLGRLFLNRLGITQPGTDFGEMA